MQTTDLFLQKRLDNDEFARVVIGRNRSNEETVSVTTKWRSCKHLFVKVRESKYIGAYHSSDCETIPARYECVRCGLTNRLIDTEDLLGMYAIWGNSSIFPDEKEATDETTEWKRQQPKVADENLLSGEPIKTTHPGVLFDIAIELCLAQGIATTKQNLFKIMKELYDMETDTEHLKISTTIHASALIERYKTKHELYRED